MCGSQGRATRVNRGPSARVIHAIEPCQDYSPYLRSEELTLMAYRCSGNLAVIGEAVRALPTETRDLFPG